MTTNNLSEEVFSLGTPGSALVGETPTTPALDSVATQCLAEALPESMFQLVVREAYLFRAGQAILNAMKKAKAPWRRPTAKRPPFPAFRRHVPPKACSANLASADLEVAGLAVALECNTATRNRLRQSVELPIVGWLRANDEAYYAEVVVSSLEAEWRSGLTRFDAQLTEFTSAIATARNSLVRSQSEVSGPRFASTVDAGDIARAAKAGAILVSEAAATNARAAERDRQIAGAAREAALPRLPAFDFTNSLQEAAVLPVPFLHRHFGIILEHCEELRAVGLRPLRQQAQQLEAQHVKVKEAHLDRVWQALREFALQRYVDDVAMDEVVQATEQMVATGAFA